MLELKCLLFFSMSKMLNYKKVKMKAHNTWTEEMLQEALHKLYSVPGATIRRAAKKYKLEESTIRFQLRKRKANLALGKEGCN